MKLIEGMKLAKELQVKADDLRKKVGQHSAHLSIETPVYPDQKKQVREWLQAHEDITRQIANLMLRVTKTNVLTKVKITLGTKEVEKPIAEWVLRRRLLAKLDEAAWTALGDRGLKEQAIKPTQDSVITQVTIVRCFDPVERDNKITLYREEPGVIDRTLEVVNATTDLLE